MNPVPQWHDDKVSYLAHIDVEKGLTLCLTSIYLAHQIGWGGSGGRVSHAVTHDLRIIYLSQQK